MSEDPTWNGTMREDIRVSLRNRVMGEIRLAKSNCDDIIQLCRDVYIEDECPEDDRETLVRFAKDELERAAAKHSMEQARWPSETDCDRLDRVEATLRDRGILLWQASPCCDTCTGSELTNRIDEIERRHPGFRDRVRGYTFYVDQNMADMLADDTHISVFLAFGWLSPDGSSVEPGAYKTNALGIAREVCDCLRAHGIEVEWDGGLSKKIRVSLNWQRRTAVE